MTDVRVENMETEVKAMTKREAYTAVVNGNITDELVEYFTNEIAKIDAANVKRREKKAEADSAKAAEIRSFVADYMTAEKQTASMLVEKMTAADYERADGKAVNVQYVSSMCRKAVDMGLIEKFDVKIASKGTQKAYCVAAAADNE